MKKTSKPAFLKKHPEDSDAVSRLGTDADLRRAGISWDDIPVVPDLDAQILAIVTKQPDKLDMDTYHCGTAHCRAGWAVILGGAKALEKRAEKAGTYQGGAHTIGAAIHIKSQPKLPTPNFFDDNEGALLDMGDRVLAGIIAERRAAKRAGKEAA